MESQGTGSSSRSREREGGHENGVNTTIPLLLVVVVVFVLEEEMMGKGKVYDYPPVRAKIRRDQVIHRINFMKKSFSFINEA